MLYTLAVLLIVAAVIGIVGPYAVGVWAWVLLVCGGVLFIFAMFRTPRTEPDSILSRR
jgi:hypothetical protein